MHDDVESGDEVEISPGDFYEADNIQLTTVGIDVGSSTSHLMFSHLHLQRLGKFLSSRYVVVERKVIYRSAVLLTPYNPDYTIDAGGLEVFFREAYREAGFTPNAVDTGAIILTGEAVKRTNARAIADLFASQAGKFVCASAGPNLEAIMAANGSGAIALSRNSQGTVLNVDIGGGTCKLCLVRDGEILETAALNVGGRLVAVDGDGRVTRIENTVRAVVEALGIDLRLDWVLSPDDRERLAETLADYLFAVVRREQLPPLAAQMLITPPPNSMEPVDAVVFSGGVSEYIYQREERDFGDLGHLLGRAIRKRIADQLLPAPMRGVAEGIRATVIGASQFTVQVSGNTISVPQAELLPLRNVQVVFPRIPQGEAVSPDEMERAISGGFQRLDVEDGRQLVALAVSWNGTPSYTNLRDLAAGIVRGLRGSLEAGLPLILVFTRDFARSVGHVLREDMGVKSEVVCIDNVDLQEFDYIDIGEVLEPAHVVPVVVKSLVFPDVQGPEAEISER